MRITLLGTGTSHGVPMIACDCEVCTSTDPCDRRTRPSIHVEAEGVHILVDTAPELRLQCLANGIRRADAVLFTHHHADHVTGLDDLRRFNWIQEGTLACYAQEQDIEAIKSMFSYAFENDPEYVSHKPDLQFTPITGPFRVQSLATGGSCEVRPIPLVHGPTQVLGYRLGNFAYCTDCNHIPESSCELLEDLEVIILDALRLRPHPTHFNLEQAVQWAHRIGAHRTYFTHIAHELLHRRVNAGLPAGMRLGFDGQVIEL